MTPGLRGPAGDPCKSEDITGWALKITKVSLYRQLDKLRLFLVAFNIIHVYNILGMLY